MQLRTTCRNLVIAGTSIIWIIKLLIRPQLNVNGAGTFLLGIAPNLLGAYLVPFGAYWLYTHPKFFNGRLLRFPFFSDSRLVCLFGFALAITNEYLQLIPFFGRTFDFFDIVFSAVGLVAGYYRFSWQRRLLAV